MLTKRIYYPGKSTGTMHMRKPTQPGESPISAGIQGMDIGSKIFLPHIEIQ